MGYYTSYDFEPIVCEDEREAVWLSHKLTLVYQTARVDGNVVTAYSNDCKWYSWQKDMEELSKDFPNILFELTGDGEESDDMWKARVKDGRSEVVKVKYVFPEFKEIS